MKIAFVIHSMSGGGAERVTSILCNAFAEQGHDVLLATVSGEPCVYGLNARVKISGLNLAKETQGVFQAIKYNFLRLAAVRRVLNDFSADVVIGMMTTGAVLALIATRGMRIPVIVSERTHPPMLPVGKLWNLIRRITYPWSQSVVMLTQDGLEWLNKEIPSAHGVVIPNPVVFPLPINEPVLELEQWVKEGRSILLAVGRLDADKQFDILISAYSIISSQFNEWDLVILGDGPDREKLERQIQSLGLESRVRMPGRAGNIRQWYERADLFVLSSKFEGFPNVLVEAMAHGCAVVSYDCDTGPRDIIKHDIDGLLVKPVGDIPALSAAISQLMRDSVRRKEFGVQAKNVAERFSKNDVVQLWDALIRVAN